MGDDTQKASDILGDLANKTRRALDKVTELHEELTHHATAHTLVEKGVPEPLVGHAAGAGLNLQNLLGLVETFGLQLAVQVLNQLLLGEAPKLGTINTGSPQGSVTGLGTRYYCPH